MEKICNICNASKAFDKFYNGVGGKPVNPCKECLNEKRRNLRKSKSEAKAPEKEAKMQEKIQERKNLTEKTCIKCNTTRSIDRFYYYDKTNNYNHTCKDCLNIKYNERRAEKNKEKVQQRIALEEQKKQEEQLLGKLCHKCSTRKPYEAFNFDKRTNTYQSPCLDCYKKQQKERNARPEVKQKNKESRMRYYSDPIKRENRIKQQKEYRSRIDVKKRMLEYVRNYRKIKKEHVMKIRRLNYKHRMMFDSKYRIRKALRTRISDIISKKRKFGTTMHLIGCDIKFFNKWIEYQFDQNMNWNNYSSYWVLDHINPCAAFDLSLKDQQLICFNWKNLRPLEKIENMSKSDKIDNELIAKMKIIADEYEKTNQLN